MTNRKSTRRSPLIINLLIFVQIFSQPPSGSSFIVTHTPETTTTKSSRQNTVLYGLTGDFARGLGRLVGKSEWKQVPDAFREGFEESEANARARNAKPMESLPQELPDKESQTSSTDDAADVGTKSSLQHEPIMDADAERAEKVDEDSTSDKERS